jgi:hypothetical protein
MKDDRILGECPEAGGRQGFAVGGEDDYTGKETHVSRSNPVDSENTRQV